MLIKCNKPISIQPFAGSTILRAEDYILGTFCRSVNWLKDDNLVWWRPWQFGRIWGRPPRWPSGLEWTCRWLGRSRWCLRSSSSTLHPCQTDCREKTSELIESDLFPQCSGFVAKVFLRRNIKTTEGYSPHVSIHNRLVIGSSSMAVVQNGRVISPVVKQWNNMWRTFHQFPFTL